MADDLRGSWKEVGKGLGHAFSDLGKTIGKSAATGVKKVDEWANGEAEKKEEPEVVETKLADEEPGE